MEFKKCMRCGCFFISDNDVCCNCLNKDKKDIANINSTLGKNNTFNSIEDLSIATGINVKNLNRFISNKKIPDFHIDL